MCECEIIVLGLDMGENVSIIGMFKERGWLYQPLSPQTQSKNNQLITFNPYFLLPCPECHRICQAQLKIQQKNKISLYTDPNNPLETSTRTTTTSFKVKTKPL